MKVLVTGSRGWTNKEIIARALDDADTIVHGNARGADNLANEICLETGKEAIIYPAEWDKYGKSAGIIRNKTMLEREKPDKVLAFWDGKSRGTKHMIDYARSRGYSTYVFMEQL